jgi:hypothetical protein
MTISTKKKLKAPAEFHLIFLFHPYPLGYHGNKMKKESSRLHSLKCSAICGGQIPVENFKIMKQGIPKISTSGFCICLGQALISRTPHSSSVTLLHHGFH